MITLSCSFSLLFICIVVVVAVTATSELRTAAVECAIIVLTLTFYAFLRYSIYFSLRPHIVRVVFIVLVFSLFSNWIFVYFLHKLEREK